MVDSTEKLQDHGSPLPKLTTDDSGLASRMLQACALLLDIAISSRVDSLSQPQQKSIIRIRQLLCIWGDDHGAHDGALDTTLQKSKHLMKTVISILREFLNTSYEGMALPQFPSAARFV